MANLNPPDFLDYPDTELILIGASTDVTRELGLSLHPRRETEQSADIFTMLGMERICIRSNRSSSESGGDHSPGGGGVTYVGLTGRVVT